MLGIRRREFITLLSGAATWPLTADAEPNGRVQRIGALIGGAQGDAEREANVAAFRNALAGLGWVEGRNLSIDWRWAAGEAGRARMFAAERDRSGSKVGRYRGPSVLGQEDSTSTARQ
jgi:putative ABC transport system substrate-binding protein